MWEEREGEYRMWQGVRVWRCGSVGRAYGVSMLPRSTAWTYLSDRKSVV